MRRTLRKSAILRTTVLVAGKNGYELRLSPDAMECALRYQVTGSCSLEGMAALPPEAAVGMVES